MNTPMTLEEVFNNSDYLVTDKDYLEKKEDETKEELMKELSMPSKPIPEQLRYYISMLGCPYSSAPQNFYIDSKGEYGYFCNKAGGNGDIAISRFGMISHGYTTVYQDSMILKENGHG